MTLSAKLLRPPEKVTTPLVTVPTAAAIAPNLLSRLAMRLGSGSGFWISASRS
ncbi:MAG: hypothetical protein ACFB5Z_08865 [Elainellaceae cyanobacterium]